MSGQADSRGNGGGLLLALLPQQSLHVEGEGLGAEVDLQLLVQAAGVDTLLSERRQVRLETAVELMLEGTQCLLRKCNSCCLHCECSSHCERSSRSLHCERSYCILHPGINSA